MTARRRIAELATSITPWRIERPCSGEYRASRDSGKRDAVIAYLVVHVTQQAIEDPAKPTDARGVARYFASSTARGSTQLVVGDLSCFRTLPDELVPWGAPPLNAAGVHVEIAGRVEWSRARWLVHVLSIRRAAHKSAIRCRRHGIPATLVDVAELLQLGPTPGRGRGGVTTHAIVSRAFGDTDHTDPGPGFPMGLFMALLRRYLKRAKP